MEFSEKFFEKGFKSKSLGMNLMFFEIMLILLNEIYFDDHMNSTNFI